MAAEALEAQTALEIATHAASLQAAAWEGPDDSPRPSAEDEEPAIGPFYDPEHIRAADNDGLDDRQPQETDSQYLEFSAAAGYKLPDMHARVSKSQEVFPNLDDSEETSDVSARARAEAEDKQEAVDVPARVAVLGPAARASLEAGAGGGMARRTRRRAVSVGAGPLPLRASRPDPGPSPLLLLASALGSGMGLIRKPLKRGDSSGGETDEVRRLADRILSRLQQQRSLSGLEDSSDSESKEKTSDTSGMLPPAEPEEKPPEAPVDYEMPPIEDPEPEPPSRDSRESTVVPLDVVAEEEPPIAEPEEEKHQRRRRSRPRPKQRRRAPQEDVPTDWKDAIDAARHRPYATWTPAHSESFMRALAEEEAEWREHDAKMEVQVSRRVESRRPRSNSGVDKSWAVRADNVPPEVRAHGPEDLVDATRQAGFNIPDFTDQSSDEASGLWVSGGGSGLEGNAHARRQLERRRRRQKRSDVPRKASARSARPSLPVKWTTAQIVGTVSAGSAVEREKEDAAEDHSNPAANVDDTESTAPEQSPVTAPPPEAQIVRPHTLDVVLGDEYGTEQLMASALASAGPIVPTLMTVEEPAAVDSRPVGGSSTASEVIHELSRISSGYHDSLLGVADGSFFGELNKRVKNVLRPRSSQKTEWESIPVSILPVHEHKDEDLANLLPKDWDLVVGPAGVTGMGWHPPTASSYTMSDQMHEARGCTPVVSDGQQLGETFGGPVAFDARSSTPPRFEQHHASDDDSGAGRLPNELPLAARSQPPHPPSHMNSAQPKSFMSGMDSKHRKQYARRKRRTVAEPEDDNETESAGQTSSTNTGDETQIRRRRQRRRNSGKHDSAAAKEVSKPKLKITELGLVPASKVPDRVRALTREIRLEQHPRTLHVDLLGPAPPGVDAAVWRTLSMKVGAVREGVPTRLVNRVSRSPAQEEALERAATIAKAARQGSRIGCGGVDRRHPPFGSSIVPPVSKTATASRGQGVTNVVSWADHKRRLARGVGSSYRMAPVIPQQHPQRRVAPPKHAPPSFTHPVPIVNIISTPPPSLLQDDVSTATSKQNRRSPRRAWRRAQLTEPDGTDADKTRKAQEESLRAEQLTRSLMRVGVRNRGRTQVVSDSGETRVRLRRAGSGGSESRRKVHAPPVETEEGEEAQTALVEEVVPHPRASLAVTSVAPPPRRHDEAPWPGMEQGNGCMGLGMGPASGSGVPGPEDRDLVDLGRLLFEQMTQNQTVRVARERNANVMDMEKVMMLEQDQLILGQQYPQPKGRSKKSIEELPALTEAPPPAPEQPEVDTPHTSARSESTDEKKSDSDGGRLPSSPHMPGPADFASLGRYFISQMKSKEE